MCRSAHGKIAVFCYNEINDHRVDVNGSTYPMQGHQAVLIAPGQYHRSIPVQGAFERFSMTFSLEDGPLLRSLREAVSCCRVYPVTVEMENLCRSISCERTSSSPFRRTTLRNLLSLLLVRNFSLLNVFGEEKHTVLPAGPRKYTELIDAFFAEQMAQNATLDAFAAELHLSRAQVNRVLKKRYEITFREKLTRTRMAQAAWLLCHTDKWVSEIAEEVGYGSASAFHEVFRNRFGTTPEKYRQQYKRVN